MTTLAEMTEAEIEQCVGMWHDCTDGEDTQTLVLHGISDNGKDAIFVNPSIVGGGRGPSWTIKAFGHLVTPRRDLPRAWQPDGTPVNGRWDYESNRIIDHGGRTVRTIDSRRFVGEWEGEWEEE